MPTISMFLGLVIEMYYAPKEHNPPHIHVYYQDKRAIVDILTADMIEGNLPVRQLRFVQAWVEIHRDELFADWTLCQNGKPPFKIDPLK
jgi:hypothetical protein